jgi:putative ABC transport system permease protein
MEIQPIFSALRKHKIPATLIVLEIALACAVLCNAVFMIGHRIGEMRIQNAIDEHGIVSINVDGADPKLESADIPRNLAALREIPGVTAVIAINMVPLSNGSMTVNSAAATLAQFSSRKGIQMVAPYAFTSGGPAALGLQLLRGRFFSPEEYAGGSVDDTGTPTSHEVVITQHLAQRLWPGHNALGRQVYFYPTGHYTVIGVVANVLLPAAVNGPANFANATFFPANSADNGMGMRNYILRTAPQNRERVLHEAVAKLRAASPDAVVKGQTFTHVRDKYFANTRSMVWMLVQVCIVMLLVTAFSIVGLTSFWVGQRRRQIGIRRALGARRSQIAQYFQTENFLLSTAGVALGMLLAYGANLYLMAHYQLDRMPWYYLPVSAVVLWMLGQLAVLGPALRASHVPPVVATRSV